MTKKYNQLTLEQRYKIEALNSAQATQTQIASIIGVHKSTISRELKRNVPNSGINANKYIAWRADQKTRQRHTSKFKHIPFTDQLKRQAKEWMSLSPIFQQKNNC